MMPEEFMRELRRLVNLAAPSHRPRPHDPSYIAGYANGYRDALDEVQEMAEECDG